MSAYTFDYNSKNQTDEYSRTPLGITALFLRILRERFSEQVSGQDNALNWRPPTGNDRDYKNTEIYIEKWGSAFAKVENYCPAITIKRAGFNYQQYSFYDKAQYEPHTAHSYAIGQMNGGLLISCFSRKEAECEILGNLVYEFFIRTKEIIQKVFEINTCFPSVLTEISKYEEDQTVFTSSIQLNLNFDFNHDWVPISPKLQEIMAYIQSDAEQPEEFRKAFLVPSEE